MKTITALTDSFRARLDSFMIGCDSLEEINSWDKSVYGEMDVYFLNELISTILRLIAADSIISDDEVEFINEYFGFIYTKEELQEIYENCREEISTSFTERLIQDCSMLEKVNKELAEEFKKMMILICDVIAESDDVVTAEEKEELEMVRNALVD